MKHSFIVICTLSILTITGILAGTACSKPTPFGADRLEDEFAEYAYTDTLTLNCTLLPEDSLLTSDRTSTADYMLCGQLNNPVFGASRSDLYTLFQMGELGPNFKNSNIESITLYLRYDAGGFYGDTLLPQTLKVYRVDANAQLDWDQNYYSNQALPASTLIGEKKDFKPRPNTPDSLFTTNNKAPYLAIPLDNAFGQEILNADSISLSSDTSFWKLLRGIKIAAEPPAQAPGCMMAFDLNNSSYSRIRLTYKQGTDTLSKSYDFFLVGGNKFTHFEHNYAQSTVEPLLNKQTDDLLFLQGMGGLRLKVEFPYAHLLENIAVNKAELELTVASTLQNDSKLNPAGQLVFTEFLGDTTFALTSDVVFALGPTQNSGLTLFGGFPETETDQGQSVQRYRMTLTRRFQAIVDNTSGDTKNQTVYINVYPQSRSAQNVVFYGPKNATFPAKLALKYTKVQ